MSRKRQTHNAIFKAKFALETYKGDKTAAELISAREITLATVVEISLYFSPKAQ